MHTKLWVSKFKSPNFGNFETPTWESWDKVTFGCWSRGRPKKYYKGEGGGFPKSRSWWVLWVRVCPWFIRAPKVLHYALTNLLFGFYKSLWISDLLVTHPSPYLGAPTRPSTLEVMRVRECTPTLHSFDVLTLDSHLSLLRSLGVHHRIHDTIKTMAKFWPNTCQSYN